MRLFRPLFGSTGAEIHSEAPAPPSQPRRPASRSPATVATMPQNRRAARDRDSFPICR